MLVLMLLMLMLLLMLLLLLLLHDMRRDLHLGIGTRNDHRLLKHRLCMGNELMCLCR